MYRAIANKATQRCRSKMGQILEPSYDVFISHRGIETKRNIAGLLHDYLRLHGLHSFLDCKTLMPGDRLSDEIKLSVHQCKVGIPIFSPQYCNSPHCLYELALLTEMGKRLVPIFWDIEPTQLGIPRRFPVRHADRFRSALDQSRDTVGLTFDSSTGDWSKLLRETYDALQSIFLELDEQNGPDPCPPFVSGGQPRRVNSFFR